MIKKNEKVQIDNEIGAQFLGHNILEYKSPDDSLDIDTFYKTSAYASLYKAYGKTVDEIKASDITVSIIRNRKPYGLFRYFTENKYKVTNPCPGIYYIKSGVLFPTQIIVTRELDTKHHTWLKALSDKLEKHEIKQLLKKIEGLSESFDKRLADSILEVAIRANKETVEELIVQLINVNRKIKKYFVLKKGALIPWWKYLFKKDIDWLDCSIIMQLCRIWKRCIVSYAPVG